MPIVWDQPEEPTIVWDDEQPGAALQTPLPPPQATLSGQLARQLGLTGRYLLEGAVSIPGLVYNPVTALINLATGARNPTLEAMASNVMDKLGAPRAATPTERVVGDASRALTAAGLSVGAGALAPAGPWRRVLTSDPVAQGLSASIGAAASGFGREEGVGPWGQLGLGLLGSIAGNAPSAGIGTVKGATRTAKAVSQVATKTGREKVAGQVLYELVANPEKAIQRLKHAPIFVPGSKPTSGGLVQEFSPLERVLHGTPVHGGRLAERYAAQNAARVALMNKLTHAGVDLDTLSENMSKSALQYLRNAEAQAAGKSIDLKPVLDMVNRKLIGPASKEGASKQALEKVRQLLYVGSDPSTGVLEDSFPMVYGIRKGISQILAGKNPDVPGGPAARKELMDVMNALDDQIKPVAPDFKRWLAEWARKSTRIERIETLRDIQNRTTSSRVQVFNDEALRTIEPGQWNNLVNRRISELGKELSLGQISGLKRISADLERSAIASRGGMGAGSNTWQNASTAYVIGSMINRKMVDVPGLSTTTGHVFSWLVDLPQQDIMRLLTDAMLDPKLAAKLMAKATPRNVESVAEALKRRAIATGIGSGIAQVTANR